MGAIYSNAERAARALKALQAYEGGEPTRVYDKGDAAELLGDVLCDLMHLLPFHDFQAALDRGLEHYRAEVAEEAQPK